MEDCPVKSAAQKRSIDAELPLYTTMPTTLAGTAALIEYVYSNAHEQWWRYCEHPVTVIEYSSGFQKWHELLAAVERFPLHIVASLRAMAGRAA
jgi:hypothetical protein